MRKQRGISFFRNCLLVLLFMLIGVRLFYKLGRGSLLATDEAWYAVNAYEMLDSGDWLVPTMRHIIDYGSKPPLGLWGILVGFKLFGVNVLGLRVYSAAAGLLTILLICIYLGKRYDVRYSIVAAAAFPALWQCFELHMFRAGDMDAMFGLFYVMAIIALAEVARGRSRMVILYGLAVGLGFMTKTMHIAVFVLVGVLYLPVIWKNLRVKDILRGVIAGLLPNLMWVAARYPVDGFKFVWGISFGEACGKAKTGITYEYLLDVAREKVTWLLAALLLLRVIAYLTEGFRNGRDGRRLTFRVVLNDLYGYFKDKYLLILAIAVPIAFYTLVSCYMTWYIDSAYLAMVWAIAVETVEISDKLDVFAGWLGEAVIGLAVAFCVLYACLQIWQYKDLGMGGRAIDQFRHDMTEFRTETSAKYDGYRAYIAYDRDRYVGDRGHWELDFVFLGYANAGVDCVDGGVEGFLTDEDSLLIMDSELWSEYADVLTGYVFLEDNTYYVLSHDRY